MRDYAFPQGFGLVSAVSREPTGVGLSVPLTPLFPSAKPIQCPTGYTWVPAYPSSLTSPKVPQLTPALLKWINTWSAANPSQAAPDGSFYFHLGSRSGMALLYSPGFNSLSVCVKNSSFAAHLTGGHAPLIIAGAPAPTLLDNPAALAAVLASRGMAPAPVQPASYTWLWVLLGLGAAGVAGYYLLD